MDGQDGSVSDANARLLKMSAIENTIPNMIPVRTVFIGKLLVASFRRISFPEDVKNAPWCRDNGRALLASN
jgi:hypothetical protein